MLLSLTKTNYKKKIINGNKAVIKSKFYDENLDEIYLDEKEKKSRNVALATKWNKV